MDSLVLSPVSDASNRICATLPVLQSECKICDSVVEVTNQKALDYRCLSVIQERMRCGNEKLGRIQSAQSLRTSLARPNRRVQSAKERLSPHLISFEINSKPLTGERAVSHQLITAPEALGTLVKYTSKDLPDCISHPALNGSLVILPGLGSTYGQGLPTLPSLHQLNEDYPFTHQVPSDHIHKPKKYSHPYYERLKKIKGWTCNHNGREVRVGSLSGETIHRFTVNSHRNPSAVRDEIVELERLIKGLSTDWSTCTVALYQNEINDLQMKVKHTLSLTGQSESSSELYDPTGLRVFCEEYDTALQALQERHRQCILELRELDEIQTLYDRAKQLDSKSS